MLIPLLVQLVLAGAALWYAIETRKYRIQGERQILAMKRQHFLTVAPFLLVGAVPKKKLQYDLEHHPENFLPPQPGQDPAQVKETLSKQLEGSPEFHICTVSNPTSKLARQVGTMLYSSQNKNFLRSQLGREVIAEKDTCQILIAGTPLSQIEAVDSLAKDYPGIAGIDVRLLKHEDVSYVLVLYRDIEGAVYAVKRAFNLNAEGDLIMGSSDFTILS